MKIGDNGHIFFQIAFFAFLRGPDFEDNIGVFVCVFRAGHDPGTGLAVIFVAETGSGSGSIFDSDLISPGQHFAHDFGRTGNPGFSGADFFGNGNYHV